MLGRDASPLPSMGRSGAAAVFVPALLLSAFIALVLASS